MAISTVNATDNDINSVVSVGDNNNSDVVAVQETTDEIVSVDENDVLNSIVTEEDLTATPKTFTYLNETINKNDEVDVYLDGDYTFDSLSDGNFADGIVINRAVTIHGDGSVIDANFCKIFNIKSNNVVLQDISFKNADCAISFIGNDCVVADCNFTNCMGSSCGGAIYWDGNNAVVRNCNFNSNKAEKAGAIYFKEDKCRKCTISNCSFYNCSSEYGAGALFFRNCDYINISDCSFDNCTSNGNGGAIFWYECNNGFINNCTFNFCYVYGDYECTGGAIELSGENCVLANCSFSYCASNYYGGAIDWNGKKGILANCSFDNCYSFFEYGSYSGAVNWNYFVDCVLANCSFTNCFADNGGALYILNPLNGVVNNCKFDNCSGTYQGGAIVGEYNDYNWNAVQNPLNITNCNFTDCHVNVMGGAISWDLENAVIDSCNFENCYVDGDEQACGGAIYWDSNVLTDDEFAGGQKIISNCNFTNCHADGEDEGTGLGGAIYSIDSNCTAYECNFTKNSARIGGATYNISAVNCEFSYNNASESDPAMSAGNNEGCIFINNTIQTSTPKPKDVQIQAQNLIAEVNENKYLVVTLLDNKNNPVVGVNVTVDLNGPVTILTDGNGQVKVSTKDLAAGTYVATITFNGTDRYNRASATANVVIRQTSESESGNSSVNETQPSKPVTPTTTAPKKDTVKLTLKKVKVKKSAKKLTIQSTLKINGKAVKGKLIKFKFNKKSYKAKTNSKGVAKITVKKSVLKKLKKGKKVTYTATYGKVTKKITVKVLK